MSFIEQSLWTTKALELFGWLESVHEKLLDSDEGLARLGILDYSTAVRVPNPEKTTARS
jgi:hypothetical protein